MGEGPRTQIPDAHIAVPDRRPGDRRLRVSWHPESSTFVFSHWVEGLCVASTPVAVADAAAVAAFLADSLPLEATAPSAAE